MAPDFKTYLATTVLSDKQTVTYRTLSRALKVHVNAAKCMLYEFHKNENKKSPGSVYATYLLSGHKKRQLLTVVPFKPQVNVSSSFPNGNSDVAMPSSPPVGVSFSFTAASQDTERLEEPTNIPIKSITLCREEKLESVRQEYDQITAIHVYSLSPARLADPQTLTDCNRAIFADHHSKQDPLIHNKEYGTIQNLYVRRRKGKRPANINLKPEKEEVTTATTPSTSVGASKPNALKREDTGASSRSASLDSTRTMPKATLKRDGSSLFKAFAKQSSKPKLERNDTDTSAGSKAGSGTGELDANADEGESEDEALFLDTNTRTNSKKRPSDESTQRERDERQAKLRKMMDDDDEAEPAVPKVSEATDMDAVPPAAIAGEDADAPDGTDDVAWSDSETERQKAAPKRRRGKRKVMKKRTMKDEDGFLVTKEEEAWESFSEDEPQQPAKKPAFSAKPVSQMKGQSQTQKNGTAPVKSAGTGAAAGKKKDIMSFFGRK